MEAMDKNQLATSRTEALGELIKVLSKEEINSLGELTEEGFEELKAKAELKAKPNSKSKDEFVYKGGIVLDVYTKTKYNAATGDKNKAIPVVLNEQELQQHLNSYRAWGTLVECVKHPRGKKGVDEVNEMINKMINKK